MASKSRWEIDFVPEFSPLRSVPPAIKPCPLINVLGVAPAASAKISMPASHSPVISNARSRKDTQLADPACPSAARSFRFVLKQKCALAGPAVSARTAIAPMPVVANRRPSFIPLQAPFSEARAQLPASRDHPGTG
jgi:hypothetical protein